MYKENAEHNQDLEKLFHDAVNYHQNNNIAKAIELYLKIIQVIPASPLVNYNLGLAYFEIGEYGKAFTCYSEGLKQASDNHDLLYNYALCAQKIGDFTEAVEAYSTILEHNPNDIDSLYNLACALMDLGLDLEATNIFEKVLALSPEHTAALNNLACVHHRNSEFEAAKKHYSKLLEIHPDHEIANHLLASVNGDATNNPPKAYIEEVFNSYSSRYDKKMVDDLEYSVPQKIREVFDQLYRPGQKLLRILDLGCGTGLSGSAFHDLSSELVGVDLSGKMVEIAAQKDIYSSLYVSELNEFLVDCQESYDVILAMDVFTYLGNLQPALTHLANISSSGVKLCFSVEQSNSSDFVLRKSGRFAHGDDYVRKVCKNTGWSVFKAHMTSLRKERFDWINGVLYFVILS